MHVILWSAICFNIMTRYTCGFFPRILAIIPAKRYTCVFFLSRILAFFPALWNSYSEVYDHFLTNAHTYAHKKVHIYALQTSMCTRGNRKSSYERHRIIPSAKTPPCTMALKSNSSLNQAWPQWLR